MKNVKEVNKIIEGLWDEEKLFLKTIGSYESTLGNEKPVQDFIKKHLNEMDMKTNSFDVNPDRIKKYENFGETDWDYEDRPVVVGELKNKGKKRGKSLILQGHIDVVSAEPKYLWDTDPYNPTIIDDKMYGRGICDMKSGVAAMIYAVKAIQEADIQLGADLQIQTVIEEECTGNGALALLDKGYVADGALITEPTELRAFRGQLGVLWVQVKVKGSGAHVERAEKAQNAIEKSAYIIQSLSKYREHINSEPKHSDFKNHPHPLNVNVGVIKGGDWASNVPSECKLEARVGFYPDQDPEEVKNELKKWILDAAKEDEWLKENLPEVSFYGFSAPGFSDTGEGELYDTLASVHNKITNTELEKLAFTATTDIRAFREFGIPTTCYGATGANMHAPNEYVELESLKIATKTIAAFILEWCKVNEENKN